MKNKLIYTFIVLSLCFGAIVNAQNIKNDKANAGFKSAAGAKKVSFNPGKRNPFLSKE